MKMDRVALVLGAGGVRGIAFTAGALAVLEHDHGWDARSADVVIGTSAGAIVGGLLRAGISTLDLAAWIGGTTNAVDDERARDRLDWPALAPIGLRDLARLRFPPRGPVGRWCRRPWSVNPAAVIAGITADGRHDLTRHLAAFDDLLPEWPEDPLWVCTVEQHSHERVAFGRDRFTAPTAAIAASCAVPGYFAPVAVGDERFLDGGVHSTTNADLLTDVDVDRVVVVAPLGGTARRPVGIEPAVRTLARRALARELAQLRQRGIPVAVIEPTSTATPHLGLDFVSRCGIREVVRHAFLDTGRQFHEPDGETFLAPAQAA
jgi:NTE family protein